MPSGNPLSATELAAEKAQLRREMRRKRQAMSPAEKQALDQKMLEALTASRIFLECEQLLCFLSLPEEPETDGILRQALALGKETAIPRCLPGRKLAFFALSPEKSLAEQTAKGAYGVREPLEHLPQTVPHPQKKTLCLVPGLAFDRQGGRLGYGAGYYDRFLAAYPQMLKIGYGASVFLVNQVPMEQTDQRLDGIATEYPLEVWNGET